MSISDRLKLPLFLFFYTLMYSKVLLHIISLLLFSSCSKLDVKIDVYSVGDEHGNDTIKWEMFPLLDGTVKVYSFQNPDYPEIAELEEEVGISAGTAVVPMSGTRDVRKYYRLLFNDTYFAIVANRVIKVDSIMNLRDLGGYKTNYKKAVKWGKLFRSGRLNITEEYMERFNSLRIRTVIDFRTDRERLERPDKKINADYIHIPTPPCCFTSVFPELKKGEFKRGDAFIFMQDQYREMAGNCHRQFAEMFDVLTDSLKYPVLILCTGGKDRVGFASTLILSALGISEDQIMDDYSLTYSIPNVRSEGHFAYELSSEGQEAVTVLLSTNEQFLRTAFNDIKKEYGSIDNYLEKALGLDGNKRKRLQQLLLYYTPNVG